jgi:hypothetical protein
MERGPFAPVRRRGIGLGSKARQPAGKTGRFAPGRLARFRPEPDPDRDG